MPDSVLFPDHYFKVSIPGIDIGMFRDCSGLSFEFDTFEWPEGGNNEFVWILPGRVRYARLGLRRRVSDPLDRPARRDRVRGHGHREPRHRPLRAEGGLNHADPAEL